MQQKRNIINICILRIPNLRPSSMMVVQFLHLTTSVQMLCTLY